MGTGLAALNVKYRDFRYVIPFVVQIMFFLSPVIYPVNMIDYPALRYLLAASPMYAVIELFRFPLTDILADRTLLTISLLSNAILLWGGILYFRRTEDLFADLA
jgi:lipopolysaccharide transport system permease protein